MAKTLFHFEELQQYFRGVNQRANHHAQDVDEVIEPLLAMVVLYADGPPVCRTYRKDRETRLTNVLRFSIDGRAVALSYQHGLHEVALHEGSEGGPILATFSNASLTGQVRNAFKEHFGPIPREQRQSNVAV